MKLTHRRAVWLMVAVTLMWSTAGIVTRQLEAARSFEVTFWRSFFTALSLLVILPLWRGRATWQALRRGPAALWWSGLCWSAMFTSFMLALTMTGVAQVLVISALGPLFTALLARRFLRQRIAAHTWLAIALAGLGMLWMFGAQARGGGNGLGSLVALCVPLSAAINWIVVQHAHARGEDVDLVPSVLLGALLSSAYTLPLAWPLQATAHDIGLLGLLGLVQLAIPCTLLVLCARVLKAPEISLLAQLEVLFGILLVWIGAGEAPRTAVLQGGALVLLALVGNELMVWKKKR